MVGLQQFIEAINSIDDLNSWTQKLMRRQIVLILWEQANQPNPNVHVLDCCAGCQQ